jgi:NAD(P)H dehydrogenase (quinone)
MNVLIILGHPNTGSFNHAIADSCRTQLINNGHNVIFHDLYNENFNPVLETAVQSNDKYIAQYADELANADGIIIIHPNWWGQPPAIIKGWLDRVFIPEIAYTFSKDEYGNLLPKGLLKAQHALVFNTSNTSSELEEKIFMDPLETIWRNRVFKFCGITNFKRTNFQVVKDSDSSQRKLWLAEVSELIDKNFPKE